MKFSRLGVFALFPLVGLLACDDGATRNDGSGAGCEGAKCDDNRDPGAPACASPQAMIDAARRQLADDEPDVFAAEDFGDDLSSVEAMDDLNGDGVADALVLPGKSYAGPNVEQTIYLTDDKGCPSHFAGRFAASDVSAAEGENDGVLDVRAVNLSGCQAEITTYEFDGDRYVEAEVTTVDTCEVECPSEGELIASAREQLVRDEVFTPEDFRDDVAFVEDLGDLNDDGEADLLVAPGHSYSGATAELTVYLSDEDGCATHYAGNFAAQDLSGVDSTTDGVRDVETVNVAGCSAEITRYAYDGGRYQRADTRTEDLCGA